MMPLFGLTAAGLRVPTQSEIVAEVRSRLESDPEIAIDWHNDLLLQQLIDIFAQLLEEACAPVVAVHEARDIHSAQGLALATLGAFMGAPVQSGRASTLLQGMEFHGVPGTYIAAGKVVQGGGPSGGAQWTVLSDVTIPATGVALNPRLACTVEGPVVARGYDSIGSGNGQVTTIVTPVPGWDSVRQRLDAVVGHGEESPDVYRARIIRTQGRGAGVSTLGMRARVAALSFIDDVVVFNNTDTATRVIQGVAMPPKSYLVVVQPTGLLPAQEEELLLTCYDSVLGVATPAGTVQGTITALDGAQHLAGFSYASPLPAHIVAPLIAWPGYTQEALGDQLSALVVEHLSTFGTGQTLTRLAICGLAATIEGLKELGTVTINGVEADLEPSMVQVVTPGSLVTA